MVFRIIIATTNSSTFINKIFKKASTNFFLITHYQRVFISYDNPYLSPNHRDHQVLNKCG